MAKSVEITASFDEKDEAIQEDVTNIVDVARGSAVRSANAIMTSAYCLIGQHIDEAVVQYTLGRLPNKVMAVEYLIILPDEGFLTSEIEHTQKKLDYINTSLRGIKKSDHANARKDIQDRPESDP